METQWRSTTWQTCIRKGDAESPERKDDEPQLDASQKLERDSRPFRISSSPGRAPGELRMSVSLSGAPCYRFSLLAGPYCRRSL
jgi:hypothetical protein